MKEHRYLVTGVIWLDCEDDRVWRNGTAVRLGSKAIALLRALMERPRTLVTKDELFERVWPDVTVSESVLTTAVKELRQALGDDARAPELIQTVYGRGYRFLGDVELRQGAAPGFERARAKIWLASVSRGQLASLAGALLVMFILLAAAIVLRTPPAGRESVAEASGAHPKSVAVLPFQDLSEGGGQQWFAGGLTEEILNSLARTPDLHVAARISTASLPDGDVREIGRRLNVAHLLEGSVRRDDNRVRVTAQLIRASDGFHLWSQTYDREAADVVTIQEDIAVAIAHALKTVMEPEQLQAMVRLGTRSVEAYEEYLKGLAFDRRGLATGSDDDTQLASEAFERARTIDPAFAAAQWLAAQSWFGNTTRVGSTLTERRGTEPDRLREYLVRIDAAIAASTGQPENFRYRSARAVIDLRFREALRLMQDYLRERPRDIAAWEDIVDLAGYAEDRRTMRRAAERIHTLSLEAGSPLSRAITASVLSTDIANAVARARRQLAERPDEALIQYQAHRALLWGGRKDEARTVLQRLRTSALPLESKLLAELRQTCADGGNGARQIAERMARLPDAATSAAWHAAMVLGDRRRAIDILMPLHRPDRLTVLMQYLVYPEFDVRPFPLLQARLNADGVTRPPPIAIPFACPAQPGAAQRRAAA
jgi:TolB-like protein/DNA-binding winged helix-turn-helix (wHTH) protein